MKKCHRDNEKKNYVEKQCPRYYDKISTYFRLHNNVLSITLVFQLESVIPTHINQHIIRFGIIKPLLD